MSDLVAPLDQPLALYETARRALAEATRVDEVLQVRNESAWLGLYAKQAKDREMMANATELRARAERRLGEMMAAGAAAGQIAVGNPNLNGVNNTPFDRVKLEDAGIDKNLAKAARKSASISERAFEMAVSGMREKIAAGGARVVVDPTASLKAETRRTERLAKMASACLPTPDFPAGRFGVILADPPWENAARPIGKGDRHYQNYYKTLTPEQIAAFRDPTGRPVKDLAGPVAVLALWCTSHLVALGWHATVAETWGFEPQTLITWDKEHIGLGYWVRDRTEHVLIATRGKPPQPKPEDRPDSLFSKTKSRRHSEKPDNIHAVMESWFPDAPKLELFGREARLGWTTWGNEAPVTEAAE